MTNTSPGGGAQAPQEPRTPKPMAASRNPFANGFVPTGKQRQKGFATRRGLLRHMLEVDLRIVDLPVVLADSLRAEFPGMFENVHRKFTMAQIMELTQLKLLFSKSDLVRQRAIDSIKDRTDGKPMQKPGGETPEEEPTQLVLPNGDTIFI